MKRSQFIFKPGCNHPKRGSWEKIQTHTHIHMHSTVLAPGEEISLSAYTSLSLPLYTPNPLPPHIWTSSKGHQGCIITHAFTTTLHSLVSHAIILLCSSNIPLSCNMLFTPSIHVSYLKPSSQPPTSDPIISFNNWSSSIFYTCANPLNPLCSTRLTNSSSPSHLLLSHSLSATIILVLETFTTTTEDIL